MTKSTMLDFRNIDLVDQAESGRGRGIGSAGGGRGKESKMREEMGRRMNSDCLQGYEMRKVVSQCMLQRMEERSIRHGCKTMYREVLAGALDRVEAVICTKVQRETSRSITRGKL